MWAICEQDAEDKEKTLWNSGMARHSRILYTTDQSRRETAGKRLKIQEEKKKCQAYH